MSFDGSQFLPATGDRCTGGVQQRSQVRLSQQVTLDLQDQALELGSICSGHRPTLPVLVHGALY
jgi:hypothetical protein